MAYQNDDSKTTRLRKGEGDKQPPFRVNRLFSVGSSWYFSTREGKDQGPFINKERAEYAIAKFVSEKRS